MILIVDDNHQDRETLKRQLTRVGYRAESVPTGPDAMDYLRTVSARLVILDTTCPTGLDVLREIRADESLADLNVVECTAGNANFIGLLSRIAQVFDPIHPTAAALPA